jgi:hypothetical protein
VANTRGTEKTVRDLVLTMLVFIAGIWVFSRFLLPHNHGEHAVTPVDYATALRVQSHEVPYRLLIPAGLSAEWKATSVGTAQRGTSADQARSARAGFVVDRKHRTYAELDETDSPQLATALIDDAPTVGTVVAAGRTFEVHRDGHGHTALVWREGTPDPASGATRPAIVLVTDGFGRGGAGVEDLTVLAASLRPVGQV